MSEQDDAETIVQAAGVSKKDKGPSQASQLVKLARDRFDMFMSEDGRPYAVKKDGPNIALPLRGRAGLRSQLARMFADEHNGSVPSASALADAMTVLEGVAGYADPRTLHLRVARHQGQIVVDLGTSDGACVVVDTSGWQRVARSPVIFRRTGAMKPLPVPTRDGDGLAKFGALLNASETSRRLLVGWMVGAFIPDIPHPILVFRGEQGSAKSSNARAVIGLVDPSGAPARSAPRDLKTWAINAFNSWAICLDNVSYIGEWLSDALCRAVTGDGLVDRALYTDDDVVVLAFRRVLAMTTIDAGALAGDLAERLLTIELSVIRGDERREEKEIEAAYADAHAAILASLFDLLAKVLKALPDVELSERPRMADFARVLAAVDKVQEWKTLDAYQASARNAVADVLEGEPFAQAVVKLVRKAVERGFSGLRMTAQDILDGVETPDKLPKKWPKDATRCGGQIKRLAPVLRTVDIDVNDSERQPDGNRSRIYTLTTTEDRRNAAPGAPTAPATADDLRGWPGAVNAPAPAAAPAAPAQHPQPGAAGASPGATESPAPGSYTGSDQQKHHSPGAAGAPGAGIRLPSTALGPCVRCQTPTNRYGENSNPLCTTCRADAE